MKWVHSVTFEKQLNKFSFSTTYKKLWRLFKAYILAYINAYILLNIFSIDYSTTLVMSRKNMYIFHTGVQNKAFIVDFIAS